MPLVSIVIPCYQERDFIVACIESVLRFELPPRWEIEMFVVDGGSTDGTLDQARQPTARDPRIHLVPNPRRTQGFGLNIGIALARGDFILRLDAHSAYPRDYLASLLDTAIRTN